MKFSENWLREIITPDIDRAQLIEQLNLLGLEVDSTEPVAPNFTGVVVAKIAAIAAHPNADRLRICEVDINASQTYKVVCGAANAREGLVVPMAMIDAELPNGLKIKKTKLRGTESFGMLCSAAELGLAESAEGLMELSDSAPLGTPLREYLALNDHSIEIDLTPNRGDCLSVLGVAREIAVANALPTPSIPVKAIQPAIDDTIAINITAVDACPRYAGRVIKNIDLTAKTPIHIVEKLRRSGVRNIHPVVDITNYVMLEMGQPMHAFDVAQLSGGIEVRWAKAKEKIALLDGSNVELDEDTLVIADQQQANAIAGIMGGQLSAVTEKTRDIFLESAYFATLAISGRPRRYGLHTDSSHRFERGVDPQLQKIAIERATELLLQTVGGKPGPIVEAIHTENVPDRPTIGLAAANIQKVLGFELSATIVQDTLAGLGMQVSVTSQGWEVIPPSYRSDINIEVDLIEELARVYGYSNLPRRLPAFMPDHLHENSPSDILGNIKAALVQYAYSEVVTYSFIDPERQKLFEPAVKPLKLSNPISSELSVMRTSLLPGLLGAVEHNLNRQQKDLKLFEVGSRYIPQDNDIKEKKVICAISCGLRSGIEAWDTKAVTSDFYDIKGDVERLLSFTTTVQPNFQRANQAFLHPGQSADITVNNATIGWVGRLHPHIEQGLGLTEPVFAFELDISALLAEDVPVFSPVSRYPQIRRDIAIEVDQQHSWESIRACVQGAAPDYLKSIILFDVYVGKTMISGRKSIGMGLILQEISRTLTDTEINSAVDQILAALAEKLGATLRE